MIPFNVPCHIGREEETIAEAIKEQKLSGNGRFSRYCTTWLENHLEAKKAILTPSCTAALEMSAILTNVSEGDEVIMPSYTFVSTANAFALRGAHIRFVDVEPTTMNIDPKAIKAAISHRTKAIVVVHYAGVACDMVPIMKLANEHQLWVIEDAAQGLKSQYNGRPLGTIGHLGTFSFHDTKNYTCGEGGALIINDEAFVERAEIIQEKGTDRSKFVRGEVDKYTWRDIGSSYLTSELNAAYLSVQLDQAEVINQDRLAAWYLYQKGLKPLEEKGILDLPTIPTGYKHNAHMFYIKTRTEEERNELIKYLKEQEIMAVTHYVPLHQSEAGKYYGSFSGEDVYTTSHSSRLLRLPLYYGITKKDVAYVIQTIQQFYSA
ncbi:MULTISPECIES: dTDP-4-amino-4,6-dideoxygalactose transaminase [Oceanobacillus]|uniref:dTDP-4-amino-4,6-dideoxygalactose transaminase n=1 Tax=Oceanobacillus kimchii TaxID=746691 RepID=A0ABQ5TL86_9BACI|nr:MULTISPECIES: dTDP-4-amino-4,6-dideoxygalactose transaminase [Oceanobacillus]MBT2601136.1 dTDP-4-amino-4,6-dideoxygalactose transaminase [Oceanobacillus sp. ISL-74]MBT2652362.1 dTDP-4-amino-4,6-dideoxygalactose transaminase [Oceanobacillus sp. ISL-73]GLO67081.1 dTDP-4-amino-4,6-dideoxygalactose transaminase [Oceanobacillus kimchii]